MCELPNELPKNLRLRKSRHIKKISEKLVIDNKTPAGHPKAKFRQLCWKIAKIPL